MAILACQPCLTSVLGPAALGVLGLSATRKSKKGKKQNSKKTKKKKKSSKKGGSGYETQEEYNSMNNSIYNYDYRDEEIKKECSDFMKFVIKHKTKDKQNVYANESFKHKQKCKNGDLESCDFCRKEYLKLLFEDEKKSKSKSKSKSRHRSKGGGKKKKVNRNYKKILENNLSKLGL